METEIYILSTVVDNEIQHPMLFKTLKAAQNTMREIFVKSIDTCGINEMADNDIDIRNNNIDYDTLDYESDSFGISAMRAWSIIGTPLNARIFKHSIYQAHPA